MLCLTRKKGETIVLKINTGEGRIEFKVLDLGGGKVRLGIDAPDAVKILRGELIDSDTPENTDAGATESGGEGAATKAA